MVDNKYFEDTKQKMLLEGYKEHNETISVKKANYLSILYCAPFMFIFFSLYQMKYGGVLAIFDSISQMIILIISSFLLIVIHEAIHGLTWGLVCENGLKSIKFGVFWSSLTPYCHCKEPLTFNKYIIGALMPFIILGIGFAVFGIVYGSLLVFWLGMVNILGAGGDLMIAMMLRNYRKAMIIDHPSQIGFVAYQK